MFIYLASLLLTLSSVTSNGQQVYDSHTSSSYPMAASSAQIKFAIENKYDDTGPAEHRPVYAYNTYKNLEDALVAYFDDPDTKLPEFEKAKAVNKLLSKIPPPLLTGTIHQPKNYFESTYRVVRPQFEAIIQDSYKLETPGPNTQEEIKQEYPVDLEENTVLKPKDAFTHLKLQAIKDSSVSLAHYTRDPDPNTVYQNIPKYAFSYGVHDFGTGDIKRAAETRQGGTVHGFYSFIDADGKQRLVHYQADDKEGFRASVRRLPIRH